MSKWRKKYTPEEAKEKLDILRMQLQNEREAVMLYQPGEMSFLDIYWQRDGGYLGHFMKQKNIIEEMEYVRQFLKEINNANI